MIPLSIPRKEPDVHSKINGGSDIELQQKKPPVRSSGRRNLFI